MKKVNICGALLLCFIILVGADIKNSLALDWYAAGDRPQDYEMGGDPTVDHGSENAGFITSKVSPINGYGAWFAQTDPGEYLGEAIKLSAYVKTENVMYNDFAHAASRVGLWIQVDGPNGQQLNFDNMLYRPIAGTRDWQEYEVIVDVPENSTEIIIGFYLAGTGKTWVDGLRLEPAPRTWDSQNPGISKSILSLKAVDENTVWAGASEGVFLRTSNGGTNWSSGTVPGAEALNFFSIAAIDQNTAYFMGQNDFGGDARIYKTSDGGLNWTLQYHNTSPGVFLDAIAFWDKDHGVAFGDPLNSRFMIVTTTNGGADWNQVPATNIPSSPPGEVGITGSGGTSLAVWGTKHAWFGTSNRNTSPIRIFRSTDQGNSWTAVNTPLSTIGYSHGIATIAFQDSLTGFAGGADWPLLDPVTALVKTTDGGQTWTPVASFLPIFPSTLVYVPGTDNSVLFVTSRQGSGYSDDGGATWKRLDTQGYPPMSFASPSTGWAASSLSGQIVKFARNLIPTGIADQQPEHPEEYGLAQNYPNPFNPLTSIRFSLPNSGFVILDVYDLNGREIATLVNGLMTAGSHAINFDGSQLASGIYLYRLRAGKYVEAKKMTLVK